MSRFILPLHDGWLFQADTSNIGKQENWSHGLPEGRAITVPHTWNIEEGYEQYRGNGWYEYRFIGEKEWANRCIRIQFQGVYRTAELWMNGQRLDVEQSSGYLPFEVEITEYIKLGTENRLVVCVNNEQSPESLPYTNSFDWADDGGIFREVFLVGSHMPAIHYVDVQAKPTLSNSKETAEGIVSAKIFLLKSIVDKLNVHVQMKSFKNNTIVYNNVFHNASIDQNTITLPDIHIDEVKLWHFDSPELYEIMINIQLDNEIKDNVTVRTGFRQISINGKQFLLNNEPVRLMGVEWMPGSDPNYGMADTEQSIIKMLTLMKEANCVLTRFHWQQSEQLLNWCDEHGILVQEEVPYWQQPFEASEPYISIARAHISDMVRWHKHHPSIFAWGVGNELDGQSAGTKRYVQEMKPYIEAMDDSRLCNYVSNTFHFSPHRDATGDGDILMWNDYIGTWHSGVTRDDVINQASNSYPDKPLFVVEYGLCEPAFTGGDPRRIEILENQTNAYAGYSNIAGAIFFSLNDYRTQMGEDGEGKFKQRVHGVTDIYGNAKDSYWHLREISSPIILELKEVNEEAIHVEIKVKELLPKYTVAGYELEYVLSEGENELIANKVSLPILAPGEQTVVAIPAHIRANSIKLQVNRGTGFSVCTRRFSL